MKDQKLNETEETERTFPKTLVLDASYRAIHVIDWQDALCLMFLEKAEVIHFYEDIEVRSSKNSYKLPSILRVNCKSKILNSYISLTRINIFKRDKYRCAYCGNFFTKKELTLDHIQPISRNGDKKSWDNLITACGKCNHKKAAKTPEEARMPLLFKPITPKWTPKAGLNIGDNYPKEWENWIY